MLQHCSIRWCNFVEDMKQIATCCRVRCLICTHKHEAAPETQTWQADGLFLTLAFQFWSFALAKDLPISFVSISLSHYLLTDWLTHWLTNWAGGQVNFVCELKFTWPPPPPPPVLNNQQTNQPAAISCERLSCYISSLRNLKPQSSSSSPNAPFCF